MSVSQQQEALDEPDKEVAGEEYGMSIILDHVSHTYEEGTAMEFHALKDINLVIPDGQFIGVIGHTGSGKLYADPASERTFEADRRSCVL